jgi:hypothetical protein
MDRVRQAVSRFTILSANLVALTSVATGEQSPPITVSQLLADGWEIAGYSGLPFEGRSLVLFKHKDRQYLVQCSILYDVTRTKRVAVNCYEVR